MASRVNISTYLENILNAVYGEEVRTSIHDSIEALHQEVEEDVTTVTDSFTALTPAGYAADAKAIHEQAVLIRGKLTNNGDAQAGDIDFDDISTSGVYRLVASETYLNSPLTTSTGWLVVYQFGDGGRNCMQIVYESGTNSNRTYLSYIRTYSATAGWGDWQSSSFAIDDTLTVAGCAADAKAVGDAIAELAYTPIEFTDLNYNIETQDGLHFYNDQPLEYGMTVTSIAYQWILNKEPVWVRLNGVDIPIDSGHPTNNQGTMTGLTITTDRTWTFKAKESPVGSILATTASRALSVIFTHRVFWGTAVNQLDANSAFVESFRDTGSLITDSLNLSFTVTAATGTYIWFMSPVILGTPAFTFNGFTGGFILNKIMTFTNKYGFTDQYYVLRSVQPSLGNVTISVSKA